VTEFARVVRRTGLGPTELLEHADVCEELREQLIVEDQELLEQARVARSQAFLAHAEGRFAQAAARARGRR
jgi:hypothetical protein